MGNRPILIVDDECLTRGGLRMLLQLDSDLDMVA